MTELERTPKCALCDWYEEQVLQYKEHYQTHLGVTKKYDAVV